MKRRTEVAAAVAVVALVTIGFCFIVGDGAFASPSDPAAPCSGVPIIDGGPVITASLTLTGAVPPPESSNVGPCGQDFGGTPNQAVPNTAILPHLSRPITSLPNQGTAVGSSHKSSVLPWWVAALLALAAVVFFLPAILAGVSSSRKRRFRRQIQQYDDEWLALGTT